MTVFHFCLSDTELNEDALRYADEHPQKTPGDLAKIFPFRVSVEVDDDVLERRQRIYYPNAVA